jgi:putative methylase
VSDEQYITPSSIAGEVIWKAWMNGEVEGKAIADLGAGTGTLGIGCLLLGAKKVFFVEKDKDAIEICHKNLSWLKSEGFSINGAGIIEKDVSEINLRADLVIMNPPFGTKQRHADLKFLEKAFEISKVSYSFHKTSTIDYLINFSSRKGFFLRERFDFKYMLSSTMKHHLKEKEYILVSCLGFQKKK